MNARNLSVLCFASLCAGLLARGQGNFQNLDFESATLVAVPGQPPYYQFAQAFPGWTDYVGGVQQGLRVRAYTTSGYEALSCQIVER